MKTFGLILFGSLLTVGVQILIQSDYSLVNKAEASAEVDPCQMVTAFKGPEFQKNINYYYRKGYRVKGINVMDGALPAIFVAVMCK